MVIEPTRRTRLKVLRAERDLTQMAVALRAGLSVARYWYIETANAPATKEEAEAIAKVFGSTPRRLGLLPYKTVAKPSAKTAVQGAA